MISAKAALYETCPITLYIKTSNKPVVLQPGLFFLNLFWIFFTLRTAYASSSARLMKAILNQDMLAAGPVCRNRFEFTHSIGLDC